MSRSLTGLIVNSQANDYFLSRVRHDSARAQRILSILGAASFHSFEITDFDACEAAIYDDESCLGVGAYGQAAIVIGGRVDSFLTDKMPAALSNILADYAADRALVFSVVETVGFGGFVWIEHGRISRAWCPDMDLDSGERLPEETPSRSASDIAFAVTGRILPAPVGQFPAADELPMELFSPRASGPRRGSPFIESVVDVIESVFGFFRRRRR